ncbi:MAG TPA: hypothetical protein VK816_01430 [Jatrophihabitantaceae bacterium]|nr:hypothetical protein [Jatrophihabitantaceae bacterium]
MNRSRLEVVVGRCRTVSLLASALLVAALACITSAAGPAAGVTPAAGTFASLAPVRLLDTRTGLGGTILDPNSTLHLQVTADRSVHAPPLPRISGRWLLHHWLPVHVLSEWGQYADRRDGRRPHIRY